MESKQRRKECMDKCTDVDAKNTVSSISLLTISIHACLLKDKLSLLGNVAYLLNHFLKQALVFTCLQYKSFENTVGKEEIAPNEQFLLFSQCFLTIWRTFCYFHQNCHFSVSI